MNSDSAHNPLRSPSSDDLQNAPKSPMSIRSMVFDIDTAEEGFYGITIEPEIDAPITRADNDYFQAENDYFEWVIRTRNTRPQYSSTNSKDHTLGFPVKNRTQWLGVKSARPRDTYYDAIRNWVAFAAGTVVVLFCTSMLFCELGNWYYGLLTLILEPAACLCTILPWMKLHPSETKYGEMKSKTSHQDLRIMEKKQRDYGRGASISSKLRPRTATLILILLTLLKTIAVVTQPTNAHYLLLQPGETNLNLPFGCQIVSVIYVVANQILLFMYVPWLHRKQWTPNAMSIVAFSMPVMLILTSIAEIFNLFDNDFIESANIYLWSAIGISWIALVLRDCKKDISRDIGYLSALLWINQILPIAAGRGLYTLLLGFCHRQMTLVVALIYWSFSACFLQLMKRAALCATTCSHASEILVFQQQHTFDVFFVLLYLNTNFPSSLFVILLMFNFIQVIVRDGDFIGLIQEWIRKKRRVSIDKDIISLTRELRGIWRLLTIQNSLSERIAWLEATVSVAFEVFVWGFVSTIEGVDVITNNLSQVNKLNALVGYLILGVTLLLSQRIAGLVWARRLLSSGTAALDQEMMGREGGIIKGDKVSNMELEQEDDVPKKEPKSAESGKYIDSFDEAETLKDQTVHNAMTASFKDTEGTETLAFSAERPTGVSVPLASSDESGKARSVYLLKFHGEYMKRHFSYFRVVIVYVMCTAFYSIAKINVELRQQRHCVDDEE